MSGGTSQRRFADVARTPRMVGLLLLLLALAAVFGRLGAWQLDRASADAPDDADGAPSAEAPAAVPLDDVLAPQEPFGGDHAGRQVVAEGRLGPDQVLVPRPWQGRPGAWVVAPLDTSAGTLAVVRGWLPEGATPPEVPDDVVRVEGWLEAGEASDGADITSVSPAQLVNRWGGPMYSGFLVQSEPSGGLSAIPRPAPASGWDLQNLAYAVQWWLFAGAAVLVWVRMVRDEARSAVTPAPDAVASP